MPSATVHASAAAAATRGINKHGRAAVLVSLADTGSTPWAPTHSETLTPVVVLQTRFRTEDERAATGSDRVYLVDGAVEPTTAMRLRDENASNSTTDYAIVAVEPVEPGTRAVLYRVYAKA